MTIPVPAARESSDVDRVETALDAAIARTRRAIDAERSIEAVRLLECVAALSTVGTLDGALIELVSTVARHHDCRRVAFGWSRRSGARMAASSHADAARLPADLVDTIAAAMDEALEQRSCIAWPATALAHSQASMAQARLARSARRLSVCTVPMFAARRPVGALVLERDTRPFDEADQLRLVRLSVYLAPLLATHRLVDRPLATLGAGLRRRPLKPHRGLVS